MIPKHIWLLWFQGWDRAPEIAQASLASWRRLNPEWRVHALDLANLGEVLPEPPFQAGIPHEAASDLVRLALLRRHGGVWADATTICAKPLGDWLPAQMAAGFFAFSRPAADKLISTWFLAAELDSFIVAQWQAAAAEYWAARSQRDDYFWAHKLFGECYESNSQFRADWDKMPKHSASHKYHFSPNSPALLEPPTGAYADAFSPSEPVLKLTHKLPGYDERSLMARLCQFARGEARP